MSEKGSDGTPLYPYAAAAEGTYRVQQYEYRDVPGQTTKPDIQQYPPPEVLTVEEEKKPGDEEVKGDEDEEDDIPEKYRNLEFNQVFKEHKSTQTFSILYKIIGYIYKYPKLAVYHAFVIVFGIFFALLWGIINGIMVFVLVWIWNPALKLTLLILYTVAPAATAPYKAIVSPLVDVSARIFRQIRIKANFGGGVPIKLSGGEHIA